MTANPMLDEALRYASFGWHVLPCEPLRKTRDFTYRWLQPELVRRTLNPLPAIFRGA